jgi:two-component system phosphate regulon sensor histidine kinase PhoR
VPLWQKPVKENNINQEFLSILSHDVRTLIHSIYTSTSLILDEPELDDETRRELLTMIAKENARLSRLFNNLICILQMDNGSISVKKSKVDLKKIIQRSIDDFKRDISKKKVDLQFLFQNEQYFYSGDELKLYLVFQNLIDNAIKYSNGSVVIKLENSENVYKIYIEDNGIGISEEMIEKVYDRFFTIKTEKSAPSPGIGLTVSKEIIKLHGGEIKIASELGKGAKIEVILKK